MNVWLLGGVSWLRQINETIFILREVPLAKVNMYSSMITQRWYSRVGIEDT